MSCHARLLDHLDHLHQFLGLPSAKILIYPRKTLDSKPTTGISASRKETKQKGMSLRVSAASPPLPPLSHPHPQRPPLKSSLSSPSHCQDSWGAEPASVPGMILSGADRHGASHSCASAFQVKYCLWSFLIAVAWYLPPPITHPARMSPKRSPPFPIASPLSPQTISPF